MGYGTGSYGLSPFGIAAQQASTANPARVSSSRKIDPLTGRLVQGANGGYAGMPDTAQAVRGLVLMALKGRVTIISEQDQRETEQAIRLALRPLYASKSPVIELINVTVGDDGRDMEEAVIEYRDIASQQVVTVKPRLAP